jgi:hypothetical protein
MSDSVQLDLFAWPPASAVVAEDVLKAEDDLVARGDAVLLRDGRCGDGHRPGADDAGVDSVRVWEAGDNGVLLHRPGA